MTQQSEPIYRRDQWGNYIEIPPAPPPAIEDTPHPSERAIEIANAALANGARWEEAAGGFVGHLVRAAMVDQDPRVVAVNLRTAVVDDQGNVIKSLER